MKIVSIDIETTGLDPATCQILQIGAVIDDTQNPKPIESLPKFKCLVEHTTYSGSAYALSLNSKILDTLAGLKTQSKLDRGAYRKAHNIITPAMVATSLSNWLSFHGCETDEDRVIINAAGKNFASFDKLFLEALPGWGAKIKIRSRIIDPAVLATNWQEDKALPGLSLCKARADLADAVSHDALEDAVDVVCVLRKFTNNYGKPQEKI